MNYKMLMFFCISFGITFLDASRNVTVFIMHKYNPAFAPIALASEARWAINNQRNTPENPSQYPLNTAETITVTGLSAVTSISRFILKGGRGMAAAGLFAVANIGPIAFASSVGYAIIANGYRKEWAHS